MFESVDKWDNRGQSGGYITSSSYSKWRILSLFYEYLFKFTNGIVVR